MLIVFPIALIEWLTMPRSDAARSDAVVTRVLHESAACRAAHALIGAVVRAKRDSMGLRMWNAIGAPGAVMSGAGRNRLVSLSLICMGVTVLALLEIRPVGPLAWIVPAIVVAAGAMGWLAADPLARAMAVRHR